MDKIDSNKKIINQNFFRTERINAFSDGVFAIAITLLILVIHVPTPQELTNHHLLEALINQWPNYLGFVLSFIMIGIVWSNHHAMFSHIKKANHVLLLLNLLLLMDIVFIPFPTYLLALYTTHPYDQATAVAIYSGTLAIGGIFFNLILYYALKNNLVEDDYHKQELKKLGKWYVIGPVLYLIAFCLSFIFNGTLGLLLCIFLAVFYLFPFGNILQRYRLIMIK